MTQPQANITVNGLKENRAGRFIWPALAFLIPFAVHALAFAAIDVSPFRGRTKSMMVIDNFHQYSPFLIELREILKNGGSLLYSWNSGLGTNYWARYAYYLASPLNLLFVFFPAKTLPEFIVFLSLFRTGFSGFSFYMYARGKSGRDGAAFVAFAVMYAASAYMLAYYWNIMWFDCIALLPLIMLGLERLARGGRGALYCAALAVAMFSNYYIALIICIFAFVYYITYSAAEPVKSTKKSGISGYDDNETDNLLPLAKPDGAVAGFMGFIRKTVDKFSGASTGFIGFLLRTARFAGYSLLAAGLASVILIPTSYALSVSQSAGVRFPPRLEFYYNIMEIMSGHLFNIPPSVMSGKPNLYCGVAVFILIPLYFLNKKYPFREKAAYGILLIFLILSCNINYLNYMWHGLHFPNSLPYRFTFLYIFVIVALSLKAYIKIEGAPRGAVFGALAAAAAYALVMEKLEPDILGPGVLYPTLIFLILSAAAVAWAHFSATQKNKEPTETDNGGAPAHMFIPSANNGSAPASYQPIYSDAPAQDADPVRTSHESNRFAAPLAAIALILLTTAELSINAGFGISSAGIGQRNNYMENFDEIKEAVDSVTGEDGFYRVEFLKDTVSNTPSLYGYRGASYFSSTAVLSVTDLMGKLGLRPSSAWYIYKGSTPVINSMFSIRYLLTWDDFYDNPLYPKVGEVNGIHIYENPYALPLGFFAERDVLHLSVKQPNVFRIQNDFLRRGAGTGIPEVMRPVDVVHKESKNTEITSQSGSLYNFRVLDTAEPGYVNFTISPVPGENYGGRERPLYLYVQSRQIDYIWYIKGNRSEGHSIKYYPYIIDMQYFGDTDGDIEISLKAEENTSGSFEIYACYFDEGAFMEAFDTLSSNPFIIESFTDTKITGVIHTDRPGTLFTTIPYDRGWSVRLDGARLSRDRIELVGDGFIAVNIGSGTHEVEFTYMPEGFLAGLAITIFSAVALTALILFFRQKKIDTITTGI